MIRLCQQLSVSRRSFFVLGLALLGSAVFAFDNQPTDIEIPSLVTAGSSMQCKVTTNAAGTVHLTSVPAGVVDVETTVPAGTSQLTVPVASGASGSVTVYLSMAGSTHIVGTTTVVTPQ